MFSMTILGAVVAGSILDQAQAWDLFLKIFGNTALNIPAQIAGWLAAIATIAATAFLILKKAAAILAGIVLFLEKTSAAIKKACNNAFWGAVARPFQWIGILSLKGYRWAKLHRK